MHSKTSQKIGKITNIILIFLTLASLSAAIFFAAKTNNATQTIEEQSDTIDKQKEAISVLSKQYVDAAGEIESLRSKNSDLIDVLIDTDLERSFWHEYAVIVTSTGNKYHTYGCSHISGRAFWIYNIDAALSKGYTPCLDCNPPQ